MAALPRPHTAAHSSQELTARLHTEVKLLEESGLIAELVDLAPLPVLVLNAERQILYSNSAFLKLHESRPAPIIGQRIGDVLDCRWAQRAPKGCGTGRKCSLCKALAAIETSSLDTLLREECRVLTQDGRAYEFQVEVTRRPLGDSTCMIVFLKDNSAEKQRQMIEKIFFHDILNTAGAMHSFADMLLHSNGDVDSLGRSLHELSSRLIDEIRAQQMLVRAEEGTLTVQVGPVHITEVLAHVAQNTPTSPTYRLEIQSPPETLKVKTDITLLLRVLGNMVKNACEAAELEETIIIGARTYQKTSLEFFVHNRSHIPLDVQEHIFVRTFSTKDEDRGHGTYGMKLLGEKYLRGKVGFTSDRFDGTCFYIRLPIYNEA